MPSLSFDQASAHNHVVLTQHIKAHQSHQIRGRHSLFSSPRDWHPSSRSDFKVSTFCFAVPEWVRLEAQARVTLKTRKSNNLTTKPGLDCLLNMAAMLFQLPKHLHVHRFESNRTAQTNPAVFGADASSIAGVEGTSTDSSCSRLGKLHLMIPMRSANHPAPRKT